MNFGAFYNTLSSGSRTLPLVVLYVTEGCNLQCITCSYRVPRPGELTLEEIRRLGVALKQFGLRHIVFSGGEPLMRRDLPEICRAFLALGVKQSLLTNGLLLEKRIDDLRGFFTEIIVSIDGPSASVHNGIRGVDSFDAIIRGVTKVKRSQGGPRVSFRTVVQKKNFRGIAGLIDLATSLGVDRVSFLAADVLSSSFGRQGEVLPGAMQDVMLDRDETAEFRRLVDRLIVDRREEFNRGFIAESPGKMLHLVEYYEALAGQHPFPRNICNAPMISAVITSTGELLPCFFLPSLGSIRKDSVRTVLNTSAARTTRDDVRSLRLERCRTCVCTLNVRPLPALLDRF